jgi:hypothetical protein
MTSKVQLASIIDEAFQEFKHLDTYLSPEILKKKGTLTKWEPRDDVIHCAFYVQQFADRLKWPRDHAKADGDDYLKVNDEVWEKHQKESWEEALGLLETACQAVVTGSKPLSEAELNSNRTFTWLGEQSPAQYIIGLIYVHGMMHIQYALMREGLIDAVIESADKVYRMSEKMDSSEVGRGRNLYNKACSYALAGRGGEAISMVKESVKLAPNLLEWSKQDTDLDGLRDNPEFKLIYE